jgi:pyruvate formate lyase activating enzyme
MRKPASPRRTGRVFGVQTFSVHDGPGIRTLVFLKGCPLKCRWCSNPEGISPEPSGPEAEAGSLAGEILKDRPFFGEEGGVTLSGGEPFAQPEFAASLLEACKGAGVSTAVETSLHADFGAIESCLPFIDFFMFDLKIMDERKHADWCGAGNRLILGNALSLARAARMPLLPRMPLVPGVNDDEDNIARTAEFLKSAGLRHLNLIPYMRLGIGKYERLKIPYGMPDTPAPSPAQILAARKLFSERGISAR